MTKYVLSSGQSVVTQMSNNFSISNIAEDAIKFDTIGDAMRAAVEINKMINHATYKAVSIEV